MSSQDLIAAMKIILPTNFVAKESDAKLSAYLNLCLGDVNLQVPQTNSSSTKNKNQPIGWFVGYSYITTSTSQTCSFWTIIIRLEHVC